MIGARSLRLVEAVVVVLVVGLEVGRRLVPAVRRRTAAGVAGAHLEVADGPGGSGQPGPGRGVRRRGGLEEDQGWADRR